MFGRGILPQLLLGVMLYRLWAPWGKLVILSCIIKQTGFTKISGKLSKCQYEYKSAPNEHFEGSVLTQTSSAKLFAQTWHDVSIFSAPQTGPKCWSVSIIIGTFCVLNFVHTTSLPAHVEVLSHWHFKFTPFQAKKLDKSQWHVNETKPTTRRDRQKDRHTHAQGGGNANTRLTSKTVTSLLGLSLLVNKGRRER